VTLLATETIEARFKRCQEKTPTCDGKKTPACDEAKLSGSAQIKSGKTPYSMAKARWKLGFTLFFLQGKCRITPMKSLTGAAYLGAAFLSSLASLLWKDQSFLDFIRYDNK
jgi:hypothetical protein